MDFASTPAHSADYLQRPWIRIVRQVFFLFLFSMIHGHLLAATYYVDSSNSTSGTGTYGNPWQKISAVNGASFAPGDNILFKRGGVWHESLVIPSSGTTSQPITFGAYGAGDPPLFDGTYTGTLQWNSVPGYSNIYKTKPTNSDLLLYKGVVKAPITTVQFSSVPTALKKGAILLQKDTHYTNLWVTSISGNMVSGITFFNLYPNENVYVRQLNAGGKEETWSSSLGHPTITASPASLTESGHWYRDGTAIYLYSATDPNTIDVKTGKLVTGIDSNGKDFLKIQDIAVQGYSGIGVHLTGTRDSVVQDMKISNIGSSSHQTGILINNSTDNIIKNNRVESVLRVGIGIYAGYSPTDYSHGNRVIGNTVLFSGSAGISLNTDGPGDAGLVRNNIIDGNSVYKANSLSYDAAGIYALYIGSGNVLQKNTIKNCGSMYLRSAGIMLDAGVIATTISNNTIENNSLGGVVVTGAGHRITGNTLVDNGVNSWESAQISFFTVTDNASGCTVRSNTVTANGGRKLFLVINGNSLAGDLPHAIDYNAYSSENPNGFCWNDDWVCDQWVSFSSWKNETGQDSHSTFSLITPSLPSTKNINGVYHLLL